MSAFKFSSMPYFLLFLLFSSFSSSNITLFSQSLSNFDFSSLSLYSFPSFLQTPNVSVPDLITLYAKSNLYGISPLEGPDFQKALFFFKLGADLGNSEARYYLSMLQFFEIDTLFVSENIEKIKKSYSNSAQIFNENNSDREQEIKKGTDFSLIPLENLQKNVQKAESYLKNRATSISFTSLYFSSIEEYKEASLSLGYRYSRGEFGKNCPSAILYYNEVNKYLYIENDKIDFPKFLEKKRIGINGEADGADAVAGEEEEFLRVKANVGNMEAIMKLGYYYFYGIKGVKRDLEKAFDYFGQAAFLGDVGAKATLGYMYMKGLGVAKNYGLAYKELNEAALKKEPKGKYGLGLLYINGHGVPKNEKIALKYFKEAADHGDAEGQYLYGSYLLISNLTENHLKKDEAHKYITMAAHQGHAPAMYALGLMHLDGSEMYYSCELALKLFRSAAERGQWADKSKEAFNLIKHNKKSLSFVLYLELSYLGFPHAQLNAALLLEKDPFPSSAFDPTSIPFSLSSDKFYQSLTSILSLPPPSISDLFSDYLQIIKKDDFEKILSFSSSSSSSSSFSESFNLMKKLYTMAEEEGEGIASLKLGDLSFYHGEMEDARKFYSRVIELKEDDEIMSQASFNLGYMEEMGIGGEKNITKALEFYNKSYSLSKDAWAGVLMAEGRIWWEEGIGGVFLKGGMLKEGFNINFHFFTIGGMLGVIVALITIRVRMKNYVDSLISLKEE